MRTIRIAALLAVAPLALSSCAYQSAQQQEANACRLIGPKAMVGSLAGAAGGAAIGAAAGGGRGAAIGAGVGLLAGLIAGHIADSEDCSAAQAALEQQLFAAQADGTITWSSKSGHVGEYRAVGESYTADNGALCRRAESLPPPGSGGAPTHVIVCRSPGGNYTYAKV